MIYRQLGRTGMSVSVVGYGAWGIGGAMWQGSQDAESLRALHRAVERGINFFDTALVYGDGHSERLVGRLLRERTEPLLVATKIPPKNMLWPARRGTRSADVFPGPYIIGCTEESLRNLGVERIDLQQLHVWLDEWVEADEIWTAVDKLRQEGKLRAFGISINDHEPASALRAARTGRVDALQVIYNIYDQSPQDELFPACRDLGIGILARVPLDEGGLTGAITPATTFPPGDWRGRYFKGDRKQQVAERAEKLGEVVRRSGETASLPELALRFCLSHPAVSTVIPGMRTAAHVDANTAVGDGRALSDPLLAELAAHRWQRNFYS